MEEKKSNMKVEYFPSISQLVIFANGKGIQHSQIVTVIPMPERDSIALIYYE